MVLQNSLLGRGHFATEQKIIQRVFGQNKVTMERNVDFLEINTKLLKPEPVKDLSVSLESANPGIAADKNIVCHRTELLHEAKLFGLRQ